MQKQQIIQEIQAGNTNEEVVQELTALVDGYPDELDAPMVEELLGKIEQYTADNAMLERAWDQLGDDLDNYADAVTTAAEDGISEEAAAAHKAFTFAQEMDEE